jgi:hypothetical protein
MFTESVAFAESELKSGRFNLAPWAVAQAGSNRQRSDRVARGLFMTGSPIS